ncbi:alcohol dehydrogenase catalytic domain-containing protein [bacterium]|nr:alcohol dehydrogenase catalytic domain-containing protein [bacterium]
MKLVELRERYAIDNLMVVEGPVPEVRAGEVLIQINACSLNYRDLLIVRGYGRWKKTLPFVPLSDAAGEVVEVGPGVSRVAIGDSVAAIFVPAWLDGDLSEENDGPAMGEMLPIQGSSRGSAGSSPGAPE